MNLVKGITVIEGLLILLGVAVVAFVSGSLVGHNKGAKMAHRACTTGEAVMFEGDSATYVCLSLDMTIDSDKVTEVRL